MNPQHCFTWASSVWNMWIPWSSEGSETRVSTVVRRAQGTGVTSVWSPHKLAGLSWLNSFFYQPLSHNCWLHLLLSTVLKGSKPFHLWKKKKSIFESCFWRKRILGLFGFVLFCFHLCLRWCFFFRLGMLPWHMTGKHPTTELHPHP